MHVLTYSLTYTYVLIPYLLTLISKTLKQFIFLAPETINKPPRPSITSGMIINY